MRTTTPYGPPALGAPVPGRYRFLASARWARIVAAGLLVSLACTLLGTWQWNRHTSRVAAAELVEANYDAVTVPLTDVLAHPSAKLASDDVWRPVSARGTYLPESSVLLRNRPVEGTPAHHVLALFQVADVEGPPTLLVVDRGWLPAGSESGGVPPLPQGVVDVVVRLRPPEPPSSRVAPTGQVYAVDPERVLAASGTAPRSLTVLHAYGVLAEEDPEPASAPQPLPRPKTDLGTHLSYTLQWWVFALGALVGVVVLARREAKALSDDARATVQPGGGRPGHAAAPRPLVARERGGRRLGRAEQEEDAILDAQETAADERGDGSERGATLGDRSGGGATTPPRRRP